MKNAKNLSKTHHTIVIFGKKGSGKNTIANMICQNLNKGHNLGTTQLALADPLKETIQRLFDAPRECLYGTDEQKNQLSYLLWENMPGYNPVGLPVAKSGHMTWREIMQYFGTEVFRKADPDIWCKAVWKKINKGLPSFYIVTDGRFDNEFSYFNDYPKKAVTICLDRYKDIHSDSHASEKINYELPFDFMFNNNGLELKKVEAMVKTWTEQYLNTVPKPSNEYIWEGK